MAELRVDYISTEAVVDNTPELRVDYVATEVVTRNNEELRIDYLATEVVVSNTHTHVFVASDALATSSASAYLDSHAIVLDPLRAPPHHVVKSLSVRITTIGGLHD